DPTLAAMPVIPSDVMNMTAAPEETRPVDDLIKDALQNRPDITQSRIDLTNRDISKRAARNALLPGLDLFAFYGGSRLGGPQNPAVTCAAPTCTPAEISAGKLPPGTVPSTGFGDAFGNQFDSSAPDKGVGLTLNIPLRNRAAQANQVRSELEY